MKRSFSLLLFMLVLYGSAVENADGQFLWKKRRVEASVGLGPSFFFGDIGGFSKGENILGFKDISFLQTRVNFNFNLTYRISQRVNARLSFTQGKLSASDTRGSNVGRKLGSSISIFEPAVLGEYYFIKNITENSWNFSKGKGRTFESLIQSMDFYALAGFGGLSYSSIGNEELLKAGLPSSGFTMVIPVGVGAKLIYSPDFDFGIELAGRYALTDYVDGFTSQYSRSNDVYYFLNFTFTYKMPTRANGLPLFGRRR